MKKIMITAVLVSFAVMTQAQIYLGGNLGFSSTTNQGKFVPKDGDEVKYPRTTNFTLAPMAAKQFSEKLALGAQINFGFNRVTNFNHIGSDDLKSNTISLGIGVFAQYTCLQFGNFSLLADAGLSFAFHNTKDKVGSASADVAKGNNFGINVTPVLAYDLNERVRLTCHLHFFELGFNSRTVKSGNKLEDKMVYNNFNLGLNSNSVAHISWLTVGVLYKL